MDTAAITAAVGGGSLFSATLELFATSSGGWGTSGREVDLQRMSGAWSENGATWNCPDDAVPNARPDCAALWMGGSFEEEATDSALHTNATSGRIRFDVTEDVRAFLSGTQNHGWLAKLADETVSGDVAYGSRQGAGDRAPQLILLVESALVDPVPPMLVITAPSQAPPAVIVNDTTPQIALSYSDGGSGVDLATLAVQVDGLATPCTAGPTSATCEPAPLSEGHHAITASLRDRAGNSASAAFGFDLLIGPGRRSVTFMALADTYLRQGATNRNFGNSLTLNVRQSGTVRSLVSFDSTEIARVLGQGTLGSAVLQLTIAKNVRNWGRSGRTVDAHRLTADWTEGGATWSCAVDSVPANRLADCTPQWAGGSFNPAPTATVLHTNSLTGSVAFDVTADVENLLAGTPSYGWLLKKTEEGRSGWIEYASREAGAATAPRLVVSFDVPAGGDTTAPRVEISSPADGTLTSTSPIAISGLASDDVALASVKVDGREVAVANGVFQASVELLEGGNAVFAEATDASGNRALASTTIILDTMPPALAIESPHPDSSTNQPEIEISGSVTDLNGVASLTVAGRLVSLSEGRFAVSQVLAEGPNTIAVEATDTAGNRTRTTLSARRFSLPSVTITAPKDLSYLTATAVDVEGTVSGPVSAVSVNGVAAQVAGATYVARGVPLLEGGNVLTATATDAAAHAGSASVNVVRDLTPPRVTIDEPVDGARLFDSTVTVSGLVNDIVDGTVNAEEATVNVNGRPSAVANRSYTVKIPLVLGDNVLTAIAVDKSGNVGQTTATVHLEAPTVRRVVIVDGDGQLAEIATPLTEPLTASLLDSTGQPVPATPIVFSVRGNDGSLNGGKRQLAVLTDASGRASAHFTLGTRVGVGNQWVEASAVGFRGPALFRATALPGAPKMILVDSGSHQVGVAGQALPRPVVAVVTDAGFNRLLGVPVRFHVAKGCGHFADGSQELLLSTDSDGRAIVSWVLDSEEGIANNVLEARIDGLADGPVAGFVATGWVAADAAQTSVSGVVLDNSNRPVPGVTLRLRDTAITAVTDAQGLFRIAEAPVGTVKLIVDGSTTLQPGSWPDLEFVLTTVPGRDNTLGMPVFLLPLDLGSGLLVDETHGGDLTLSDLPGFRLEIAPGSVVFPGGSRSGIVSVTVVHEDKVPMVPNFGQQPRLIVTIQPTGARFEPPARLTLPNVEGLAPGQVAELYSFDHDLGHFVSIGPGTVSEDASVITSNRGVGILKAGWHCCGFPQGSGAPNSCPECTKCTGDQCVPKKLCEHCGPAGNACDGEGACQTGRGLIPKICNQLKLESTSRPVMQCPNIAPPLGAPTKCGAALTVDYTRITHSCDSVDLKGASNTERVVPDHRCTPLDFTPDQGGSFVVKPGNDISGNSDFYSLCAPLAGLSTPYDCTETYIQDQEIDGCVRKVTITFHITRTATGCSASISRHAL